MRMLRLPHSLVVAAMLVVAPPSLAKSLQEMTCDGNGFCMMPTEPGKLNFESQASVRKGNPPSSEQRLFESETFVIRPKLPKGTKFDTNSYAAFDSGDAVLHDNEKKALETLAQRISGRMITRMEVHGYADIQQPTKETRARFANNKILSEARAKATAEFLKTQPLLEQLPMEMHGMGEEAPPASCDARGATVSDAAMEAYQECLSVNRRVEIRVWYAPEIQAKSQCKNKKAGDQQLPFRISVDGEPMDPLDVSNSADLSRCTDIALEKADIQVRFDGLEVARVLNITATPGEAVYGEKVSFTPYSNYAAFIKKAELRMFKEGASLQSEPLAVVPMKTSVEDAAVWAAPTDLDMKTVQYVLRVYDADGKFDETTPKLLTLLDTHRPHDQLDTKKREELVGYGENHLGTHNIPISGGAVTINGSKLAPGTKVWALDRTVPVDANGAFAYRQILPSGEHSVRVVTEDKGGDKAEFARAINIPDNDWFYVALGDLTAGKNHVNGPAALVTGQDTDRNNGKIYADGRAAFYAKGKVKGDWLLTASADTQEQPLGDLFSNFSNKDPRYLLKRIDPNAYYPIYGDDSTTTEDAPTQGKFYVRLERGDTKVLWGNFQTRINGTELVNYSRGLYGASVEHKSQAATKYGERKTEVNVFAADPGSLSSLEEFRGTGGSLYYLRAQDVVVGSERVRVEVRDQNSGIVLQTTYLTYGQDYDINYLQGRVTLTSPLSSVSGGQNVVQNGASSGNPAYLVVGYEYTPGVSSVSSMVKGGHASQWLNDYVKLGITGYKQDSAGTEQELKGADVTLRYAPGTYLKLEAANSKGAGNGALSSQNGGFNFATIPQTATAGVDANAYRVETGIDLGEIRDGLAGKITGYTMKREDGFSAPGQLTNEEVTQSGIGANLPLGERTSVDVKGDLKKGKTTGDLKSGEIAANYKLTKEDTATVAVNHTDRDTALGAGVSNILAETGKRTDAAIKLLHAPLTEDGKKGAYEIYGLGQGTVSRDAGRSKNNRLGVGGRYDVTDRIGVNAEVSDGNGGIGSKIGAEYRQSDRTTYYANYLMDNERTDIGYRGRTSSFVTGAKSRYNDSLSVFTEQRYQGFDNGPSGLIHAYGLDLAASDAWSFGGRFENGTLSDPFSGDTDRIAASLSAGYSKEKTKYAGVLEWRDDDNNVSGERTSWLMKNHVGYQVVPDWRFQGGLDFAISDAGTTSAADANYTELSLGYAYRPVMNDRLNALVKYTYLSDHPSPGQLAPVGSTGAANGYEQRSHVFAVDAIYDVVPKLAIGGKLGYRFGQLRDTATNMGWFDSAAWLAVARADYHIVKAWDATAELRYLNAEEANDAKAGALVGVYRHIDENVKLGVGYNFTDFSDDLTNLDYTSQGPFINLIAAF